MHSRIGSRLPIRRRDPRPSLTRNPRLTASVALTPARRRRLAPWLDRESRGLVETMLAVLQSGMRWSARHEAAQRLWRGWMRDGRWVDFWRAYVALLSPDERRRWLSALSRPAHGLDVTRRAWRLVSTRILLENS